MVDPAFEHGAGDGIALVREPRAANTLARIQALSAGTEAIVGLAAVLD